MKFLAQDKKKAEKLQNCYECFFQKKKKNYCFCELKVTFVDGRGEHELGDHIVFFYYDLAVFVPELVHTIMATWITIAFTINIATTERKPFAGTIRANG